MTPVLDPSASQRSLLASLSPTEAVSFRRRLLFVGRLAFDALSKFGPALCRREHRLTFKFKLAGCLLALFSSPPIFSDRLVLIHFRHPPQPSNIVIADKVR